MSQLVASERDLDMTSLVLQHVSQRRPSAVPNPGQVRDFRSWEAQLRGDFVTLISRRCSEGSKMLVNEQGPEPACKPT